ncbi:hypothetical protein L6R50_21125 [Myxococcota bacterium]|nr:hypothetical protein [Myxococcota bacterium]
MSSRRGRLRIALPHSGWIDRWMGALRRLLRLPPVAPPPPLPPPNVDLSLLHRLEGRHVREFVEGIEDYQLADHRGRSVHVTSTFRMPAEPDLARRMARVLARHLRFGVVDDAGDGLRYLPLRAVDVEWDETGTRAILHLGDRLAAGTRASISGWLPAADDPVPDTPGPIPRVGAGAGDDPSRPPPLRLRPRRP